MTLLNRVDRSQKRAKFPDCFDLRLSASNLGENCIFYFQDDILTIHYADRALLSGFNRPSPLVSQPAAQSSPSQMPFVWSGLSEWR